MTNPSFHILRQLPATKTIRTIMYLLLVLLSGYHARGQKATYREEHKSITTYPYSDPNPIPAVAISKKLFPFYPYFFFDGYTRTAKDETWKVITLENDYLEVTVLPGVGGKVWGAIEKSTGKDFIYLNHVLKFRSIGIRGPWTSGGIEHNFGLDLGHAPWTASDVDYLVRKNRDGSVSCFVGGLDLASRTEWRVEIRLPVDKAYFETNSMWYNPTPLHDAYLSWENTAYKATDDLQFYFPGTHYLGHGGDVHTWPMDAEGRDLSVYKDNNFGDHKSYHVVGKFPNWFGGYYHDSGFGSGHWAPYDDAPGKKIWIWSLARSGAIWEDLLTDTDGQYIEAQSGVKFNQASPVSGYTSPFNQLSMRPFYTELKSEVWFPVIGTGGMAAASRCGTLNVIASGDTVRLSFCPNIPIHDSLAFRVDGKVVYRELLQLKPLQVWKKNIVLKGENRFALAVEIGDDLLHYSSDPADNNIDRPLATPSGRDFHSAQHLFRVAEDMYAMRNYKDALDTYLECIEKEPMHDPALTKVAELYYRRAQFEEGLKYARKVLENNTYDGGGNFIYGLIKEKLGNLLQAEEAYSVAARSMEYRSAAYVRIAGISLQNRNYSKAATYARKALDFNRYNISAYECLIMAYRELKKVEDAENTLELLSAIDPLDHFVRFEKYLLNPSAEALKGFNAAIKNELPFETYLELAMKYVNMGFDDEAVQVLEQSPDYPTVNYWLAYLYRNLSPAKSREYLYQAVKMSPLRVFPFRLETIPVLLWAQQQYPAWKNRYYLGLVFWRINRMEKAKELFEQCGVAPDYAPFYLTRGILFKNDKAEKYLTEEDYKRALALDPDSWRAWHHLSDHFEHAGMFGDELKYAKKAYALFPENPEIGIDYAKALINSGRYKASLKVFERIYILPFEGASEGYELYEMANLSIALDLVKKKKYQQAIAFIRKSEAYPENLGTGKPWEPDVRLQDYMTARCYGALGQKDSADHYYRKIYDYSERHWHDRQQAANIYPAFQSYELPGKEEELKVAMETWQAEQDSLRNWRISAGSASPKVQWILAEYHRDEEKARQVEEKLSANVSERKIRLLWEVMKIMGK